MTTIKTLHDLDQSLSVPRATGRRCRPGCGAQSPQQPYVSQAFLTCRRPRCERWQRRSASPARGMIKTFTVENFCSFERFEVRDMRRLNLLVGDSGSGKTALLEAIYLAMGVSPELALRIRAWRNQETFQFSRATARRFALEGFVHKFDAHRAVFISFRHNVRWLHVLAQAKECRMPHFTAARALGALQFGDLRPGCPA